MSQNDNSQHSSQNGSNALFSISSQAAHKRKYHGLLKRSPLKNLRDNLFRFMDYVSTRSASHKNLIKVMMWILMIQVLIISTLPLSQYWDNSKLVGKIENIISIVAFISPAKVNQNTHLIVALVVEIIVLILELTFVFCFLFFLRMSKCSVFLTTSINIIFCSGLIYLITLFSSYFGRSLYGIIKSDGSIGLNAVSLILSLFHIIILSFAQLDFVTPILMFRPQSFHVILSNSMVFYIISIFFFVLLTTLGSLLGGIAGHVIGLLGCFGIAPVVILYIVFPYSFCTQSFLFNTLFIYFSSFANILFISILNFLKQSCSDYTYIVIIAIMVLFIFTCPMILNSIFHEIKRKLDLVVKDVNEFDNLSKRVAMCIARLSFEDGYAIGHEWVLFTKLVEKYPKDLNIGIMYARYAAIYPDETPTLQITARHLISLKHGSLEMKHCIFQIHSILQHRDSSMSTSIKKNLNKINQKTEKARGQIRYLWECIMRGNIEEIEGLSSHLKNLEEEIVRDYSQLCLVYPNNPYVAHAYSSFLREILNDEQRAVEMNQIYQSLRQGRRTREERCYYFAQHAFPTLPTEDQHSALTRNNTTQITDAQSMRKKKYESSIAESSSVHNSSMFEAFDPKMEQINEEKMQKRYVESMVDSVRLPSMRYGPFLIIFLLCIAMPCCIIPVAVSVVNNIDETRNSMKVVMYSSQLRMSLAEMILLIYQTVFHNTNVTKMISLKERWERSYGERRPLPSGWDTDSSALLESIKENRYLIEMVNQLTHNLAQYGYFSDSLDLLYTPKVSFSTYHSHNVFSVGIYSLEHIFTYFMGVAVKGADTRDPIGYLDNFEFWSAIKNIKEMLPHLETFANYVNNGIVKLTDKEKKNVLTTVLIIILIAYLISIIFLIFLIFRLQKEKCAVFDVFKALPKSALSAIVTQLNSQNRREEDGQEQVTMSAQEENALRVLSTSVETSSSKMERLWPIFCLMIIFTAAAVVVLVLLILLAFHISDRFALINPLFATVPYVHSQFCAISLGILRLSAATEFTECEINNSCPLTPNAKANYTLVNADLESLLADVVTAINYLRLGTNSVKSQGISDGGSDLVDLLTENMCEPKAEVTSSVDSIDCLSYESGISLIWARIRQMHQDSINNNNDLSFESNRHNVILSWLLGVAKHDYVEKSLSKLDEYADKLRKDTINNIIIVVVVGTIIIVICGIILVPQFLSLAEVARWSLRLLLFCQPNIVLQSKSIIKILSNNFSKKEESKDQNGVNFYETVVSHLLDGVLFLNNELTILSGNSAVGNILGIDPETILGKKLTEIFIAPPDSSSLKAFFAALQGALRAQRSPSIELEAEVVRGEENITLLLSVTAVSSSGNVQIKAVNAEGLSVLALVMKDMTSTIASNKLLVEEGIKSEKLLLMILPPVIVNKLQSGAKNISFAVKSASIMFVDIVSFTPWCGSHPAAYVMRTLNRLFAEFDRILRKYDRMTKIKCIGDCYMCAGGIFDEINQPAEHAKQAISFGIDIIQALKLLNIELGEKLRIRVGVNTGGPIVAGVLGIEKPTFDILGPDICLAAMMEHHGVPNNVHIPQHCYDLVFGNMFRIKERGDVEVKGKIYHTYVVSGYDVME